MSWSHEHEERLRTALAVIVDTTPVGVDLDELQDAKLTEPRRRFNALQAFAVAFFSVALLGGFLVWAMSQGLFADTASGTDELVDFVEARYEVELAGECTAGQGEFTSAVVRVWGPSAEGKSRIEISYPDGSSEWFVTDSLVNIDPRRIWYPDTGEQYIGEQLGNSGCWPRSNAPNDFIDYVVILRIAPLVSADNVIAIDGLTIADRLTERDPDDVETIASIKTDVYSFPGPNSQTVWFDPLARRLQKATKHALDRDGNTILSETLTVVERKRVQIEEDFLDTTDLPLYSLTQGTSG